MSSEFGKVMAQMICKAMIDASNAYVERRENVLESTRLKNGKYDRTVVEHVVRRDNDELEQFLRGVLIDAALEKRDHASFEAIMNASEYLEGSHDCDGN